MFRNISYNVRCMAVIACCGVNQISDAMFFGDKFSIDLADGGKICGVPLVEALRLEKAPHQTSPLCYAYDLPTNKDDFAKYRDSILKSTDTEVTYNYHGHLNPVWKSVLTLLYCCLNTSLLNDWESRSTSFLSLLASCESPYVRGLIAETCFSLWEKYTTKIAKSGAPEENIRAVEQSLDRLRQIVCPEKTH